MTHMSLFTGIGGIDIAAEWAGFTTVGQCEFADYPTKVLEKHWPDVPRWRDIRTLTGESFYERTGLRTVDLLSGGFPCQPFSVAGNQKGKEDDRYLWPEMLRVIRELTPRWVLGENVPGILRIAGRTVCEDLEREGYAVTVLNFEAAAVGAPHRRERVFFVANRDGNRSESWRPEPTGQQWEVGLADGGNDVAHSDTEWELQSQGFFRALREWPCDSGENVADSNKQGLQRREREELPKRSGEWATGAISASMADNDGERQQPGMFTGNRGEQVAESQHDGSPLAWHGDGGIRTWWSIEPSVGRVANGVPSRLDGGIEDGNEYSEENLTEEISRHIAMQDMWKRRGGAETPPQSRESKPCDISVSDLPQERTCCNGDMGQRDEATKNMQSMRQAILSEPFQKSQYMQQRVPERDRENQRDEALGQWFNEPDVPRIATGIKNRVDRLKCLGNAVVPQQVFPILAAIAAIEREAVP